MKLSEIFRRWSKLEEVNAHVNYIMSKKRDVYNNKNLVTESALEETKNKLASTGYTEKKPHSAYHGHLLEIYFMETLISLGPKIEANSISFTQGENIATIAFRQSANQKEKGVLNAVVFRGPSNQSISKLPYTTIQNFLNEPSTPT